MPHQLNPSVDDSTFSTISFELVEIKMNADGLKNIVCLLSKTQHQIDQNHTFFKASNFQMIMSTSRIFQVTLYKRAFTNKRIFLKRWKKGFLFLVFAMIEIQNGKFRHVREKVEQYRCHGTLFWSLFQKDHEKIHRCFASLSFKKITTSITVSFFFSISVFIIKGSGSNFVLWERLNPGMIVQSA